MGKGESKILFTAPQREASQEHHEQQSLPVSSEILTVPFHCWREPELPVLDVERDQLPDLKDL